ncbi:Acetylpolyamine aminohydrolase [bacterium HR39]|nr:Acetylpolyamine aminohydrolase [bacterium HR39]
MIRIRRIEDDTTPANRQALAEARQILRERFPGMPEEEIAALPERLRNPFLKRFRTIVFVAEDAQGRVQGVAVLLHAPDLDFCFLDALATAPGRAGRGIGTALYERVREEARALGAIGLFLEALPDDPALCPDPRMLEENRRRLAFYERFGARPIVGTKYETPLSPGDTCPPYLVLDPLGRDRLPSREEARAIVRAILERKYGDRCPPGYIDMVVESFRDDPVRLREPRYPRRREPVPVVPRGPLRERIPLVVDARHQIHHVPDRGYVEAPVRIRSILAGIEPTGLFERVEARHYGERHIRAVHDGRMVDFLERASREVGEERMLYPYVFPLRNRARPPRERSVLAGYWCIDTFTPVNLRAWRAARAGVDCAMTAADLILEGSPFAYALVRPPGHHAERAAFGGFCYFCNAAIAAHHLSAYGRVAILDVDYHHGNGQQDIFYHRNDVLTVSIHGHPSFAYPYFTGFPDETGIGPGVGFNHNLTLPETIEAERWHERLDEALRRIERFEPRYLVLALGFDTARGDPTGTWPLGARDFFRMGHAIGALGLPTLIVQEGGYRIRTLGTNARNFFLGFAAGVQVARGRLARRRAAARGPAPPRRAEVSLRDHLLPGDDMRVRALVAACGNFRPAEIEVAVELVREAAERGMEASGYHFLFADSDGLLAGYACFGPIQGTEGRFDLYWIAVDPRWQRRGVGRLLFAEVERRVAAMGGGRLYIETSSTEPYRHVRRFYEGMGCGRAAVLEDFYAPGDHKVVYVKDLVTEERPGRRAR